MTSSILASSFTLNVGAQVALGEGDVAFDQPLQLSTVSSALKAGVTYELFPEGQLSLKLDGYFGVLSALGQQGEASFAGKGLQGGIQLGVVGVRDFFGLVPGLEVEAQVGYKKETLEFSSSSKMQIPQSVDLEEWEKGSLCYGGGLGYFLSPFFRIGADYAYCPSEGRMVYGNHSMPDMVIWPESKEHVLTLGAQFVLGAKAPPVEVPVVEGYQSLQDEYGVLSERTRAFEARVMDLPAMDKIEKTFKRESIEAYVLEPRRNLKEQLATHQQNLTELRIKAARFKELTKSIDLLLEQNTHLIRYVDSSIDELKKKFPLESQEEKKP